MVDKQDQLNIGFRGKKSSILLTVGQFVFLRSFDPTLQLTV